MRCLLIVLLLLAGVCVNAQQNLVPNGDFEENTGCPSGINTFSFLKYWLPCGSPDYYHTCNNTGFGVPNNMHGYQDAQSGNAYIGLGIYKDVVQEMREYAKIKINAKVVDTCFYYLKLFFSIAETPKFLSKEVGVCLTDEDVSCTIQDHNIINLLPQLINEDVYFTDTNTVKWYELSMIVKLSNNVKWLYIGNFKTNSNTYHILNPNNNILDYAYLYIDNVQLYNLCTDSNVINWQQVKLQIPSGITVNSDGLNDKLKLMNRSFFNSLKLNLYDRWGHLLYSTNDVNFEWDGSYQGERVPIGVYQWQAEYTTIYDSRVQYATGNVTVLY